MSSPHPTHRGFIGLRFSGSDRTTEPQFYAGQGEPDGVLPTGQVLASGQAGLRARADAPDPGEMLYVTADGGTTFYPVPVAQPASRVGLEWTAGARGKPGINADIQNAAEAVRMVADPDFEVLGANATSALCTFNAEGGLTLTTAGASGDQMILAPHLDANQTAWTQWTWGTDKSLVWEAVIKTGAAITSMKLWAGLKLTNTPTVATDDHQVFFRYENAVNTGKFQCISSVAGVDTSADSGITVAVSTLYRLRIVINSSRVAKFYINGVLVATSSALTDAIDLIPYVGIEAGAIAAKTVNVFGQKLSRVAG